MGTRGFRIIRFRGRYYIFYNHWDSYPEGMGKSLVDQIPQDPDEYQLWLQQQRGFFATWDEVLEKEVLSIKNADLQATSKSQRHDDEPRQQALLDERLDESMLPCYRPGFNDLFIEWMYTVDLDREIFSIDSVCHFKLNKIPKDDWIGVIAYDDDGGKFIRPHLVPADSLFSFTSQSKEPRHSSRVASDAYESLVPRLVHPKGYNDFDPMISHGPAILNNLWYGFKPKLEKEMPYILLGLSPDDFAFREIAFAIVSLAAGLTDTLTFVDARRLKGNLQNGYMGIVPDDDPNGPAHFAAGLALGCHLEGFRPGSAPAASSYWFGGILIRLEGQLDQPGAVQQAILLAVECGRHESKDPNFDVILLSIEHAVILRVFPDHIEHTELLSLLEIPIHWTKNPLEGSNSGGSQGSSTTSDESDPPTTHYDPKAFMGLIHCFEATTVRSLSRASANDGRLPAELYESILECVDDETYWTCSKLSRHFRRHCLKNLRLIKDVVIRHGHSQPTAQTPRDQDCDTATLTFDLFDAVTDCTVPSQMRSILSHVHRPSRYLSEEVKKHGTVWQVLIGRPPEQSLLLCFNFSNFHAQIHWPEPEAVAISRSPSPRRMAVLSGEGNHWRDREEYWNNPAVERQVNVRTLSSANVFRIWESMLRSYQIILLLKGDAWNMPPNTKYAYVEGRYLKGDVMQDYDYQQYMFLVVKRSSAATQPSEVWERALEEAETEVRKQTTLQSEKRISVVVAVELSAKLFTWNEQVCALVQEPPRVLDILAEGDREIIQGFLLEVAAALNP